MLASAAQIENISGSGSVVSQFEARQADSAQDSTRDQMHNGLMSMPNGGPEETVGKFLLIFFVLVCFCFCFCFLFFFHKVFCYLNMCIFL